MWKKQETVGWNKAWQGKDGVISGEGAGRARRPAVCVCLGPRGGAPHHRTAAPDERDVPTYWKQLI